MMKQSREGGGHEKETKSKKKRYVGNMQVL
jgi:hypothetical protein